MSTADPPLPRCQIILLISASDCAEVKGVARASRMGCLDDNSMAVGERVPLNSIFNQNGRSVSLYFLLLSAANFYVVFPERTCTLFSVGISHIFPPSWHIGLLVPPWVIQYRGSPPSSWALRCPLAEILENWFNISSPVRMWLQKQLCILSLSSVIYISVLSGCQISNIYSMGSYQWLMKDATLHEIWVVGLMDVSLFRTVLA